MTEEELKAEAKKLGYVLIKKPEYQCSCYCQYPNKNHKHKNGHWKCIDKYRPISMERKYDTRPVTYCKRIDAESEAMNERNIRYHT